MNFENKERVLFILLVLGIFIVFVFSLAILIMIWMPKVETSTVVNSIKEQGIGEYEAFNISRDDISKQNLTRLTVMFFNKDHNSIYLKANKEYLKYFGLDEDKFKAVLDSKKLMGVFLTTDKYVFATVNGNNVYKTTLKTQNNSVVQDVIITEYSPKQISIAFDDFLAYDDTLKEYTKDALKLQVISKLSLINRVQYKVKLTNISNHDLVLNNNNEFENIYLVNTASSEFRTNSSVLSGRALTLIPGQELNLNLIFDIPDFSHSALNTLKVKDVYFSNTGLTKEIDFSF